MTNEMSNFEAYRILTRELTNMHCSERDALDQGGWKYESALELVKQGRYDEAIELATHFVTIAGQVWRIKQGKKFLN